jgi:hypothetical protein
MAAQNHLFGLEIIIPTYKRIDKLTKLLQLLCCFQNSKEILISVYNNDPEVDLSRLIAPRANIRVYNNGMNLGASLNIVRGLSNCIASHAWILGDDDIPTESSLLTILNDISSLPKASIKYSSRFWKSKEDGFLTLDRTLAYMQDEEGFFSNFLFISTWVFYLPSCMMHLPAIAELSFSKCPQLHLALLLLADSSTESCQMTNIYVSSYECLSFASPGTWNGPLIHGRILTSAFLLADYHQAFNHQRLYRSFLVGIGLSRITARLHLSAQCHFNPLYAIAPFMLWFHCIFSPSYKLFSLTRSRLLSAARKLTISPRFDS